MTPQDAVQTAVKAIDEMSGDELTEWVAAGDYRSVGGVSLPQDVTQRLTERLAEPEVAGFAFDFGLGGAGPKSGNFGKGLGGKPGPAGPAGHFEGNLGTPQTDFLKIAVTQILIG